MTFRPVPDCYPDTVRFRIPVPGDVYQDFKEHFYTDKHLVLKRFDGRVIPQWEKAMIRYPSSFSDMVFMPSAILQKNYNLSERKKVLEWVADSIDVEYSVHKWRHKSSAFNNGETTFDYLYDPIDAALRHIGLDDTQRFRARRDCFIRRLDLSCNFQFDPEETGYTVSDLVNTMLRFKFNRADHTSKNGLCTFKAGQSVRWGNANSLYSVIFYDKAREYRDQWKEKNRKKKPISEEEEAFYREHISEIVNILRFEVTFTTRWFNEGLKSRYEELGMRRIKHPQGPEQIQKVIDLSKAKWAEIYKLATGPLAMQNVDTLTNIRLFELEEKLSEDGRYALFQFARDCLRQGWRFVQQSGKYSRSVWFTYKRQLKETYQWDITVAGPELVEALKEEATELTKKPMRIRIVENPDDKNCPIMYIM